MRQLTKIELERIRLLTEKSIEFTLIEPTTTGLEKSILDATGPVRNYLKDKSIHDYTTQKQGPDKKILINSYLIEATEQIKSVASLYRPQTKNGDPRIWFKHLTNYARPFDIIAIIAFDNHLYVLNITQIDIHALLDTKKNNPLLDLLNYFSSISNGVAEELLNKLHKIAKRGPIPALLNADTAIGRTLEKVLGIDINSSKKPDYKGIEIKSYRDARGNRKNLFAQVPDWSISKFKSSEEILNNFGYSRDKEFKLYCTVSSIVRNSQGLKLKINNTNNQLVENSHNDKVGDFVAWKLETLHNRLLEKHNETFWIAADSVLISDREHFIFKKVEHTKKPLLSQFDILIEQGIITLDHLIKRNSSGKVVEKGPLFKIKPNGLPLLFPPSNVYHLL